MDLGAGPAVHPQPQAYTRLADRLYLFENLDGSGFQANLPVDEDCVVLDYPDLFRRVKDVTSNAA
ncbi:MAG TPA: putative glycolipid-binding domain-containing protein [Methylomirabilota bacterium]|nr:putative glycolipid-binding domain-containing protein [Methylomirabilota bacterium]